ncbi:hypothetical protein EON83_07280 [bacterium]|nr:MAG: hypothetical protein EON83_07280 [bacterium]
MSSIFAIAPWEFPGVDFNPLPQATTTLEVGGKKRVFWLKMRDGIIFFREKNRAPLFAVPHLFAPELANDPDRLIDAWKGEMARDNYGAFCISHRKWARTAAAANYCIILRADGSGCIKEHFDYEWQQFALQRDTPLDVWSTQITYGGECEKVIAETRAFFLNRPVDPAHFQTIPPHWSHGSINEMTEVLRSAAQLWWKTEEVTSYARHALDCHCKSNSAFLTGSVVSALNYGRSYRLQSVWKMVKWHYGFVGVEWKKASEHPELQAKYGPEVWRRSFEKWGENWRGNWVGEQYEAERLLPPLTPSTQHEKLEAVLTLREFLRDKMPAKKMNDLLSDALKID